jgi:hypothetical protein
VSQENIEVLSSSSDGLSGSDTELKKVSETLARPSAVSTRKLVANEPKKKKTKKHVGRTTKSKKHVTLNKKKVKRILINPYHYTTYNKP